MKTYHNKRKYIKYESYNEIVNDSLKNTECIYIRVYISIQFDKVFSIIKENKKHR